jgi:DNA polymerase-1
MDKLLIIDGMNLLFQMFYGMPNVIPGRNGKPIQGTVGFVGAMLKMLRLHRPTAAVVIFDGETHNERCDIAPDYKANRPDYSEMPEDEVPFSQLCHVYRVLDHLGIKHYETEDCETDDIIAAYARSYGEECEIVIASQDSDFFQLITEKVSVFRYRGDLSVLCTPDYIKTKLGIEPCRYADFKSLTGDNADNIKGAYKVGPKTAAQLVCQFGSLESIIENADSIAKPSIRASVIESRDRLMKNLALIKLSGEHTLPFELCEMAVEIPNSRSFGLLSSLGIM